MEMPLCDNKACKGYHKTALEEGEVQSSRGPEDFDPVLICFVCGKVYNEDDFVEYSDN